MLTYATLTADSEAIKRIHERYTMLHGLGTGDSHGDPLTAHDFATLVEAAFWASLRADESRGTRVQLRVLGRSVGALPGLSLESARPIAHAEKSIAKLAPAISVQGSILVTVSDDGITIVGIDIRRQFADLLSDVIINISAPGVVSVGIGPYRPLVVFAGRDVHFIESSDQWSFWWYLQQVLGKEGIKDTFEERQINTRQGYALVDLARAVVEHGHGAILLIVPDDNQEWLSSLEYAFKFAEPNTEMHDSSKLLAKAKTEASAWSRYDVSWIASLANVDGAVVIGADARVYGFGAKIKTKIAPDRLWVAESPRTPWAPAANLEDAGGMRHQSAIRFIAAHRDVVAVVASQDRRLSVISSDSEGVKLLRNAQWWT